MNIITKISKHIKEKLKLKSILKSDNSHHEFQSKILIFTGAGLSEESGIPTFRTGKDGLWHNYKISEVCDAKTFLLNKQKVFDFYNERKKQYFNVKPNSAHFAIADIQKKYGVENVIIYTANIDNLMEEAGCKNVNHVHGNINNMNCLNCYHEWFIGYGEFKVNTVCPNCKLAKQTKPGVVFFHEHAPMYPKMMEEFSKASILKNKIYIPILKIVIGTSLQVIRDEHLQPRRGISMLLDPNPSNSNNFTFVVPKKATKGIEEINNFINENSFFN